MRFNTNINVRIVTVLGAIAAAVLFFFGVIFAIASAYNPLRLQVGAVLLISGIAVTGIVIAYNVIRKPKTVVHQVEVSGQMKAAPLKCPNCSASVDANQIKIVQGVPYATCTYCGHTFEVTEEPKW